jgi:hypothetical protein
MDKFEEIFRMQAALNTRIGVTAPFATEEDEEGGWFIDGA